MLRRSFDRNDVVTPKRFASWPRERQLDYVAWENRNFLKLFEKLHGAPNAREEAYLILAEVMAFADASYKNEFNSREWVDFLSNDIVGEHEVESHFDWRRFSTSEWAELLGMWSMDFPLKRHCDFTKFKGTDWVKLLKDQSAYAALCPFERLEPEELDAILLANPKLAKQSGLNQPKALVMYNEFPAIEEDPDIPFHVLPESEFAEAILFWLEHSLGMAKDDSYSYACGIIYRSKTLLGVYSADYAEAKRLELAPWIRCFNGLSLRLNEIDDFC